MFMITHKTHTVFQLQSFGFYLLFIAVYAMLWLAPVLALCGVQAANAQEGASDPGVTTKILPAGLSAQEWAAIRKNVRQAEYELNAAEENGVYTARNRAQGVRAVFDAKGMRVAPQDGKRSRSGNSPWHLHLALTGYGYGRDIQAVPEGKTTTDGNRIAYLRENLTEWYVNDLRGIEQGFILEKRPDTSEALKDPALFLRLEIVVDTDLAPRLRKNGQHIAFLDSAGQTVVTYDALQVFDAEGRDIPAYFHLVPAASDEPSFPPHTLTMAKDRAKIHIVINDSQAVYPLTVDPILAAPPVKINRVYADTNDKFGSSVAVDGDTMAVGAPYDEAWCTDLSTCSFGSVYVWTLDKTTDRR
ncbi:MAG: hypothetical protein GY862_08530 [Gammaproteobacteria bacterium]|nr:hypothetical protein [Gammaproteobacteria bacterium]